MIKWDERKQLLSYDEEMCGDGEWPAFSENDKHAINKYHTM